MTVGIPVSQQYTRLGLGMFIHFNMQTFTGGDNPNDSPNLFNPGSTLNIDNWIAAAQALGAQYIVLTVKHSEGFCLWPTATTTYSIASSSPWYATHGIDIVAQFVTKCTAAGIKPCLYFSIADATLQQSLGGQAITSYRVYNSSQLAQLQADYSQPAYLAYLQAQITELLTNYGPIFGIWLDAGYWAMAETYYPWASAAAMLSFIHGLQPNIRVLNNSHTSLMTDTDVIVFEGGGAGNPPGANNGPQEFCDTLLGGNAWFWHGFTTPRQSTAAIVANFQACNANNCAYLLDVPPDATGVVHADMMVALHEIGAAL